MIGPRKIALLKTAVRQLGLDDATYRALLRRCAGVSSAKALDDHGLDVVMAELERAGFVNTSPRKPMPDRPGMGSSRQTQMIRRLWAVLTEGQGTGAQLGRWLERSYGVSALRFVDADTASKAINGLRAMLARKNASGAEAA